MKPIDETIWRYMSFTKFVDLLATQSLYFCRSDQFADPFEGSVPKHFYDRHVAELSVTPGDMASKDIKIFSEVGLRMREYVYISCWHMSEYESEALWSIYAQAAEGIAIRSRRGTVYEAMAATGEETSFWSVPVKYIDFHADDAPVPTAMAPFRYKRKSFEHEKELRFIHYAPTENAAGPLTSPAEHGLRLRVDVRRLIEGIYVAPTSADWFRSLTGSVCGKFGLDLKIQQSALADTPLFGAKLEGS